MIELPAGYKDALHTNVDVFLDWRDRIKVLFGYRLTVKVDIATENIPGKTITEARVLIWKLRRSKRLGVTESETPPEEET